MRANWVLWVIALFGLVASCGDNVKLSSEKSISAFSVNGVEGTIDGNNISLMLPFGTNTTNLTPTITFTGASVDPESGAAAELREPRRLHGARRRSHDGRVHGDRRGCEE